MIASALFMISAQVAQAQSTYHANNDLDVTLGAGVSYAPVYEGGDKYTVSPFPLVNVRYADRYELGMDGLTADLLKSDTTVFGLGLAYHQGRDEDGDTLFNNSGDDSLQGMGDIDGAIGIKGFASHDFEPVTVKGSVTQFLGDDNDGMLIDASLSKNIPMSQQLFLTPSLSTTWASDNYMDTFFGVTGAQAARSQFTAFNAESGFKDVSLGLSAMYFLSEHLFVTGGTEVKHLLGDAGDSPISEDDTSVSVVSTIGYKF